MFQLNSERLRLELMHPGEAPNNTSRFEHAGCISEIVLDGIHRFGASEPNNLVHPSSGGRGITNEIQCDLSAEAPENGYYPKFGIGLLQKQGTQPWIFYNKYPTKPFPIQIEHDAQKACFVVEPLPCMGYALRQEKTISVDGNMITMDVKFTNVGEKPISGREYCHNFLTIDSMALGPAYTVDMENMTDRGHDMVGHLIKGNGRGYTFSEYNKKADLAIVDIKEIQMQDCFRWTIHNSDAHATIRGCDYVRPVYFQMWAVDHMISVEVFHGVNLLPGESDSWKRTWEFNPF